jgi:hypothetical protein
MKKATAATAALLLIALAACGKSSNVSTQSAGANTAADTSGGTVVAAAGSVYRGKLDEEIGSKTSHDGDTFTLAAVDATGPLAGSSIEGHLSGVQAAGLAKKPAMTIVFDDVLLSDGTKVPVNVQLLSTNDFGAKSHHLRTIGMMMGGAVAGHMAAHAAGKGHGGMLGAAGGYMLSQEMKTDIDVKPGTVIAVKFLSPATEAAATAAASPQST